jgi:hypothetical protein
VSLVEMFLWSVYEHLYPSLGVWPKDHKLNEKCKDRVCEEPGCVKREAVAEFVWWWETGRKRAA